MQQFRPLPSFQPPNTVDMPEEKVIEDIPIHQSPPIKTSPLLLFPGVITEQLSPISNGTPKTTGTLSLTAALQSALSPDTGERERIVVIPGSKKREEKTPDTSILRRRLSPRLRQSIIIGTILFVAITTLTSLAPLANGQSAIPIFSGISHWVQIEQLNWQVQTHLTGTGQNNPALVQSHSIISQNIQQSPMYLPSSQYVSIAEQDALNAGISPDYFVRQIYLESGFNPNAVSPSGAVGIAQFLPSTAAGLGVNPWNPVDALQGAARLMANYAQKYNGNYAMALAAYNGGSGTVQYAVNACGSNWMNCLPAETRHYIYVVMGI